VTRRPLTLLLLASAAIAFVPAQLRAYCGPAVAGNDGWPIVAPAARVFDQDAFCKTLSATLSGANLHGIVVDHAGALQFEAYFEGQDQPGGAWFSRHVSFTADDLHDVRSITKSITGLLVGVALQRGQLKNVDQAVLDFFPEHADLKSPERSRITLAHLLTMTPGLEWDESGSYVRLGNSETRMRYSRDPDRYALERDIVAPPGTRFIYSGGATALLGEVLVRSTGLALDAFAEEALFKPLGIERSEWRRDSRERVTPYGGLRLRPRDLAKVGRMLLAGGRWNGQQVIDPSWIDASFRARVPAGNAMSYGFQWWRGEVKTAHGPIGWVAAQGNGGQRLYLAPELDLVVVVTAGQYNQPDTSWRAPLTVFRRVVTELAKHPRTASQTALPPQ
jgi:CubicO group peptidase (beta-lactamase class C family)